MPIGRFAGFRDGKSEKGNQKQDLVGGPPAEPEPAKRKPGDKREKDDLEGLSIEGLEERRITNITKHCQYQTSHQDGAPKPRIRQPGKENPQCKDHAEDVKKGEPSEMVQSIMQE